MSRRDDDSHGPSTGAVSDVDAFRLDPRDAARFAALRSELRGRGAHSTLAEILELRAPFEAEPVTAAAIWAEAGELRDELGQLALAERDLKAACALDPGSGSAAARLVELLLAAGKHAEAAAVLEAELTELDRRQPIGKADRAALARRAERHRAAAETWERHLGRVDRALHHWQAAWKLEPERTDALVAARALYAALGDDARVAELYRAELDVLGARAPAGRRAPLHVALGRLLLRGGDVAGAAAALERAVELPPDDSGAREALAEVYLSTAWAAAADDPAEGPRRASGLYLELARRALAAGDSEPALSFLRRAVGVDPGHAAAATALEKALHAAERWEELERLLAQRAALAGDEDERRRVLDRLVALHDGPRPDRPALTGALTELAALEPARGPAALRLRQLLREGERWADLATAIERDLAGQDDPGVRVTELLELAALTREHLGDKDKAAELLHQALTVDPGHEDALARYVEHFRERRDFRGLVELYEFALDNARAAEAPVAELVRRLEDIAQVCELRLGDVPRALDAWQRIEAIDPGNPRAREALRRLTARARSWEHLVGVLEGEIAAAGGRVEVLARAAHEYRAAQVEPRRAIELYEQVLTQRPDDDAALKAVLELYEREGDDPGVARTLRRSLELDARRLTAEQPARGPGVPREWPIGRRVERLAALRRLAAMAETRLGDVDAVVFACGGLLEILPGDRDALDRLERVLEQAGDRARLIQTLEYHASSASGPAERAKVLRRLAGLAAEDGDELRALELVERALRSAPTDAELLAALADRYEELRRWPELAGVLERLDAVRHPASAPAPAPGSTAAAVRAAELGRYARVVDEELGDAGRAIKAWERLRQVSPRDRAALTALARLYRAATRHRELAELLAVHVEVFAGDDPARAAAAGRERATVLAERLGATDDAIRQLERLVELAPTDLESYAMLRRLHASRGDFQAAVRIAERELYMLADPAARLARTLELGAVCRDRLGDPARALQAFERVLALDPHHDDALAAVAELHERLGEHAAALRAIERRLGRVREPRLRRALYGKLAALAGDRQGDHRAGFRFLRRAHDEEPDAASLTELRRAAESHGLWRELAEVLTDERSRAAGPGPGVADTAGYVATSRELAAIAEHRLSDRPRALATLLDALRAAPRETGLLTDGERLATDADERPLWRTLADAFGAAVAAASSADKVGLLRRRARILDERLAEPRAAVAELVTAFAWAPDDDEVRAELYRLAEKTRTWTEVLAVELALTERASGGERLAPLRRRAQVLEERLGEPARAFRAHLVGFLLAPDDAETQAQLWRLARAIGRYRDVDRSPRPEPPAATIHGPAGEPAVPSRAVLAVGDSTSPLDLRELDAVDAQVAIAPSRPVRSDHTEELDLRELGEPERPTIAPSRPVRDDATVELDIRDLGPAGRPPPRAGVRLPPPPPRAPRIAPRPPPPRPSAPPAPPPRRPPLPAPPGGTFATPWDELASAFDHLPAADDATRVRWLYRAADVWENGAADPVRAFDTLARALELAGPGGEAEARARLHRLAEEHGAWDRLAALLEERAEDARTPAAVAELLAEVAAIRERQEQPAKAEAQYRRILGMHPDDGAIRGRLEALYRAGGRWVELAASLEERTDPRLGSVAPEAERPALLRELARIYTEHLAHPHDAIETLERLRKLAPTDPDVLVAIAGLHAAIGRWSKAIEAHTRIAELAEGTPVAREALRTIAVIHERELELPERALETLRQLLVAWPSDGEALAALDRLCEAHGRWAELADVLGRRAALATTADERAVLLARRAAVLLDWLALPDEAASALRQARALRPDDDALDDRLIAALVAGERPREAHALLEARLEAGLARGLAAGELAALHIRRAQLEVEGLRDPAAARASLAAATALVPDHPTALAALDRLTEADDDPAAYAQARLRAADTATDDDTRVEALYQAGLALRDRVGDAAGARAALERALAVRPYHADAIWALAGLVEHGDPTEAARLYETRLTDLALGAGERARVLTQLAALARAGGVERLAERRLTEAIAADPGHAPAIIALADLYGDGERWAEIEALLRDVLAHGVPGATAAVTAELHRRLAFALERLGQDDAAHEVLLAADRLHRGHILVKLALGENRYRARRWREAALHLGALASHDEAGRYPTDVAQGLYHAGLAEVRSLRPDKAEALYARALELRPSYAPALQALAELSLEHNDPRRAAELLTRQATATDEPAERVRLFEALGDMVLRTLADEERAQVCYAAAVAAAAPLEARHLPLLEKLLERQDLAGDHLGAARTAELMAAFGATAGERAARLARAARDYDAGGDATRSRAAALRAVALEPADLTAVELLSRRQVDAGELDDAAALLTRALAGKDDRDPATREARAALWLRLGEVRAARGDGKNAQAALERAIALGGDGPAATDARRRRAAALAGEPGDDAAATRIELRRAIACATAAAGDVAAWSDELRRAERHDLARAGLDLALALGHRPDDVQAAFAAAHPAHRFAADEPYRGAVDADALAGFLADPAEAPLGAVLATLAEAAGILWPDADDALARAGAGGARRVTATGSAPAAIAFPRIAAALGCGPVVLFTRDDAAAPPVQVVCGSSPMVVLGPAVAGEVDGAIRFALGRAAELTRPARMVAHGLAALDLHATFAAVIRSFAPARLHAAVAPLVGDDEVQRARDEAVRSALPVRLRLRLEQLTAGLAPADLDLGRYLAGCARVADRAGLLVSGDPAAALAAVASRHGAPRSLVLAVTDPAYPTLRARLGVGVR